MQRRPAGPEPAEKRVCVSPELIDLTCDDDDFAPPRRVHKARSLESWVAKASAARDIDMHTIEQPLRRPPAAVPERGVASESLDEKPADESRTDGSSVGGKEKRFYYLANFWKVVEAVEAAYGKLFLPAELVYLQRLRALPDGSLRLFVRLLGRDPTWFRIDDLEARYAYEVTSVGDSLELLVRDGLAVSASVQDLARPDVLRDVLELLRRDEVSAVLASMRHGARSTAKKKDLTEQLVALVAHPPLAVTGEPLPVLARVLETAKRVVALHSDVKGFCQRMFRLFFLADGLNHQELFKADANIIRFPKYPLSGTGSLFPTRLHLSAWEECRLWQQRFDASAPVLKAKPEARTACVDILHDAAEWLLASSNELNDPLFLGGSKTAPSVGLGEAVRAAIGSRRALPECLTLSQLSFADAEVLVAKRPVFARYTPGHILARLSWDVLDVVLQKEKSYTLVNTFLRLLLSTPFGFSKRGEWWGRLVVNFKHLKNLDAALLMAETGLRDPCVRTGFRHALQHHVIALSKPPRRWKIPVFPPMRKPGHSTIIRPLLTRGVTGQKSRFLSLKGEAVTVEQVALEHYAPREEAAGDGRPRWNGVHSENGVWAMLFSLLLWDAIWADVPDVFHTPFQSAPLDWGLDCFYETRKDAVEKCLLRILNEPLEDLITEAYKHEGERCVGCNWQYLSKEELIEIASCIGPKPLAQVLRLLAQDYKSRMGGLPDLLLWSPDTLNWDEFVPRPAAKLVEVKGPNDRLSDKQEVWISELLTAGIHVEVLHVEAQVAPLGRAPSAPASLGTR